MSKPKTSKLPVALAEPAAVALTVMPPSAETQLVVVPAGEITDAEMGRQLREQELKVNRAEFELFIFGGMMLTIRAKVDSTREVNSPKRGPGTKGTGLKAWMKKNAPEVSEGRAYKYMNLAEALITEFRLGKKVDLVHLLTAAPEQLPPALQNLRKKIAKLVEGKSDRQLMFLFGTAAPKKKGGDPEVTVERTLEEKVADFIEASKKDSKGLFSALYDLSDRWQYLHQDEVKVAVKIAVDFAEKAKAWLKTEPTKRPTPDAAQLLMDAEKETEESAE